MPRSSACLLHLILFAVLSCACLFSFCYNPFGELAYLEGVVIQKPEDVARKYMAEKDFRSAQEFIEFYSSLPGATPTFALKQIYAEATEKRKSWTYKGTELVTGFFFGKSHENYGLYAGLASDLTAIGDIRDLVREGYNFATDQEVDSFMASLAGISLALTAMPLAKAGLAPLKAARRMKMLSPKFQESVLALKGSHRAGDALKDSLVSLKQFNDAHGIQSTLELLRRCDTIQDIGRMTRRASLLGKDTGKYLKYSGSVALDIAEEQGAEVVRHGAAYGEDALKRLRKRPGRLLSRDIPVFLRILDKLPSFLKLLLRIESKLSLFFAWLIYTLGFVFPLLFPKRKTL